MTSIFCKTLFIANVLSNIMKRQSVQWCKTCHYVSFSDCVKNFRMILPFKSKLRDVILLISIAGSCLYTACGQTQSGKSKSVFFRFCLFTLCITYNIVVYYCILFINVFILSKSITVIYIKSLLGITNVAYLGFRFNLKIHYYLNREFMK